jgi:hypothetical protein
MQQMAVEYVHSVNESLAPRYPQPFGSRAQGSRKQSFGLLSLRESMDAQHPEFHSIRASLDQRVPGSNDNIDQRYRRQSLQFGSDRRSSLAVTADNRARRCSLPNPTSKDSKPQKRRVVGNGIYKPETLPWYESSLRQEMARRAHEKKGQLSSPLPLINLRPEAEARLCDLLGEEGYEAWRQKHRGSYLLNEV